MFVQSKKRCIAQAEQIYTQAIEAYIARDFDKAAQLFKQTFDLDPLNPIYGLNTGFAYDQDFQKYCLGKNVN